MPGLADILGQDQAVEVLKRAASSGRLAHAYLFAGPAGVGKATCARALAAALNCQQAPGQGCDSCSSCHKVATGQHPDLMQLAADGQFIKIDQVRALEQHLAYPPHEGRYRVVLIDGAETLNASAANALLKSVEEPGPGTLFVLVSAAPHRVVPTLVSRCQRIRFSPLEREVIALLLSRLSEASAADRGAAAAYCEGSLGRALTLLQEDRMAQLRQTAQALMTAARGEQAAALFEAASGAGKERQQICEALDLLRVRLRDLLLLGEQIDLSHRMDAEPLQRLRELASELPRAALLAQLRAVQEAQAAVQANVNASLALENLTLCMRDALPQRTLAG